MKVASAREFGWPRRNDRARELSPVMASVRLLRQPPDPAAQAAPAAATEGRESEARLC